MSKLKTYLGSIIRDIGRKLGGNTDLLGVVVLERMLARTRQVLEQKRHQRGPKLYSLHAPGGGASARARRTGLTSSVSGSRSPPRWRRPAAGSS
ncbi:hypothetical protein QA633_09500 [Bradyrhizobium barranii]|nr:hypothetical protein [Bradyrhizobium barranii]WFT97193.1 hypothetical protein QA633_09500 [Bradyrhizobium barranii]